MNDSNEITKWINENKTNETTWREFTNDVNAKFGTSLSKEAVRKRFSGEPSQTFKEKASNNGKEYETYNNDGSRELLRILSLTDDQKESPETVMKELGYDPNNWDLMSLTLNTWQQNSVENGKTNLYQVKAKLKPKNKRSNARRNSWNSKSSNERRS